MFKLNIKSGDKKIVYKPLSITIKYLIDGKKLGESLDNLIKVSNVKISDLQKKNFLSTQGQELRVHKPDGKPDEIIIYKVKIDDKFSTDYFRNQLAGLLPPFLNEELKYIHIFIPDYSLFKEIFESEKYFYQSFIEGLHFGNYSFDKYKSENKKDKLLNVYLYSGDTKKLKSALNTANALMEGVNFTKNLQNEPAITVTPAEMAKQVSGTLTKAGIKVKVYSEKEIQKMNMGGLISVGMGSVHPPRFIVMEYNGNPKNKSAKKITLVGKGVTFDSGGISIKPSANMGEMKADMSGAAVVAGTLLAAANAKLPVNLLGLIPTAENMPSGSALRPGDIIKMASGKSVEVDNTDAEGRLILADALDYASKAKSDVIIDLATLTGACVVALGEFVAGLFTKDEKLADSLYKSGLKTYDRVWRLPIWDDYNELIKSDVADVKNVGGRWGGAITAAKFLEHFVDRKISWAHLDIAGPAMANSSSNYSKKFMTGFGVRLLFDYLSNQ